MQDSESSENNEMSDDYNVDYFSDEPLPHLDTNGDPFNLLDINDTVSTLCPLTWW